MLQFLGYFDLEEAHVRGCSVVPSLTAALFGWLLVVFSYLFLRLGLSVWPQTMLMEGVSRRETDD